jgi:hypothetical protein
MSEGKHDTNWGIRLSGGGAKVRISEDPLLGELEAVGFIVFNHPLDRNSSHSHLACVTRRKRYQTILEPGFLGLVRFDMNGATMLLVRAVTWVDCNATSAARTRNE